MREADNLLRTPVEHQIDGEISLDIALAFMSGYGPEIGDQP